MGLAHRTVKINVFVILHTDFNIDLGFTFLSALLESDLATVDVDRINSEQVHCKFMFSDYSSLD